MLGNVNSLQAQIAQGEGPNLEFKETLFFNIHSGKEDVNITTALLKGIVAFLNTNGGTLLIGVSDKGHIKGLERDYQFCKKGKQNNDGFELKFRDILGSRLKPYPHDMISIHFEKTTAGSVCKVEVATSHSEIHIDNDIYVRDGNRNLKLEGPSLSAWIKKRSRLNVFGQRAIPIKKHIRDAKMSESAGIDENLLNLVATLKLTTSVQYPWLVKHGEGKIRLTDDDLVHFKKFSMACFKQLRYLPPEVGKDVWRKLIADKSNQVKGVPPEQFVDDLNDITDNYKFRHLLEQFFTKNPARKVGEITLGRAFLSASGYQFQLKGFSAYLASHGFKGLSSRDLAPMLRKLGGTNNERIWDGRKTLNAWSMPANLFEKSLPVEPAEMEGEGG